MSKASQEASMLLINSTWQDKPSFKMIPITENCPYTECLYDPMSKVFVVISKITKTSLHMLPKLDEQGDPMVLKTGKRPNGKVIKESRTTLETFLEYYVEDREDTVAIINMFAINADTFEYIAVLDSKQEEVPQAPPSKIIL